MQLSWEFPFCYFTQNYLASTVKCEVKVLQFKCDFVLKRHDKRFPVRKVFRNFPCVWPVDFQTTPFVTNSAIRTWRKRKLERFYCLCTVHLKGTVRKVQGKTPGANEELLVQGQNKKRQRHTVSKRSGSHKYRTPSR